MEPDPAPAAAPDASRPSRARIVDVARRAGLIVALLASAGIFGKVVHAHYRIQDWIFWRYALIWVLAIGWGVACLSAGYAVLDRFLTRLPLREKLLASLAVGVYLFYLLMFLGGLCRILGAPFAIALPIAMGASGSMRLWRTLRRARRLVKVTPTRRPSLSGYLALLFGIVALTLVYIPILSPKNAAFDSVYYHLGLAEHFAAQGAITRSPEGWFVAALPQLAAVLYTWPFILPGLDSFNRVVLGAHLEFVLFLATLCGLPLLVRAVAPRACRRYAWVALFLFPAIFVYDAGLSIQSDHIAAFWAVPIALAFRRTWPTLDVRHAVLLSLCMAGALLTKYQTAAIVAAPALAVIGRAVYLAARRAPRRVWLIGPAAALGVGLVLTAPHWLKNWAWYGDPMFPALYKRLTPRPWNPDIASLMASNYDVMMKRPQGSFLEQMKETLVNGLTFSFHSNARKDFHRDWPLFGSLFTLSALWLPFLRNTRRVWALFAATQLGVFVWYYLSHVERYLQPLVPWMAAVVAATIGLAWGYGLIARVAASVIVGLQVVWGGDAPFFPTHVMMGDAPVRVVSDLIATGYKAKVATRNDFGGSLQRIGKTLPPGAVVLLHEHNPRLGLKSRVVMDMPRFQSGISYSRVSSDAALYDLYKKLGVTHLVWRNRQSRAFDSIGGDLRFFGFLMRYGQDHRNEGMGVARMPDARPPEGEPDLVAYLACGKVYRRGLHELTSMRDLPGLERKRVPAVAELPEGGDELTHALERASYVVKNPKCTPAVPDSVLVGFEHVADRKKGDQYWVRTGGRKPPAAKPTAPAGASPDPPDDDDDVVPSRDGADDDR